MAIHLANGFGQGRVRVHLDRGAGGQRLHGILGQTVAYVRLARRLFPERQAIDVLIVQFVGYPVGDMMLNRLIRLLGYNRPQVGRAV